MDTEAKRDALRATMDLAGLDEDAIAAIADRAIAAEYAPGQIITADDEPSTALYVVADGLVAVSSRGENRRAPIESVLGPGGLFGEDMITGTGMMGAVAYRQSKVLKLEQAALAELGRQFPRLDQVMRRLAYLQHEAPWIVDRLRRTPLLAHVPPAGIYPLLEGAELLDKGGDELVFEPHEDLDGLVLVLEGAVRLYPEAPGMGRAPRAVRLGAGATFGEEGLLGPEPLLYRVVAGREGCRLLRLRAATFTRQMLLSTSFRRAVLASGVVENADRTEAVVSEVPIEDAAILRSNWVALVGDRRDLPLGTLTEWLAEVASEEWGDRVLVVHLDAAAPVVPDLSGLAGAWRVTRVRLRPDHIPEDPALFRAALSANLVFIDFGEVDPLGELPLLRRVNRTIYVATDPYRPIADRLLNELNRPLLYTAVVPTRTPDPGEDRVVLRGSARIHRDLLAAAHRGTPARALPRDLRAQLSRWARAVTERRVGVALGGGGALAFAHMAVLTEMHAQGLPVDLVAGVSGGAVVGAYYAVGEQFLLDPAGPVPKGLEGWPALARFVNRAATFARVCHPGIVAGGLIADWIDGELGGVLLEDLLVPFFPVATDIDRAVQVSIRTGPIGFGVRASGSLPGPFTPTTFTRDEAVGWKPLPWQRGRAIPSSEPGARARIRYVDGGVLNNVPDDTLYLEGAQLVLASNVVPAPQEREDSFASGGGGEYFGRTGRFLRELDPLRRMDDALRSGYMMMHSPADWRARGADARYQARTTGFSFLDWDRGDEIRLQANEGLRRELLVDAVRQLRDRYEGMRAPTDGGLRSEPMVEAVVQAALRSVKARW